LRFPQLGVQASHMPLVSLHTSVPVQVPQLLPQPLGTGPQLRFPQSSVHCTQSVKAGPWQVWPPVQVSAQ
jgi:hypothetical protein